MSAGEIPDYTDDWKAYWEFKRDHNLRRRLKKAAESPITQFLPVKPSDLNPSSDDYGWSIETNHLRENPDSVLHDARSGFAKFVSDNDVTEAPKSHYDILPVNFTENYFDLRAHFWESSRITEFEPNSVTSINVDLSDSAERTTTTAAISYECPSGHQIRIPQPIYSSRIIENCAKEDCNNSVYPVSQDTQFQEIVSFEATFDNSTIEVVAAGLYTNDRPFEELVDGDVSLNLVGILRNVIHSDNRPERVFEALSIDSG